MSKLVGPQVLVKHLRRGDMVMAARDSGACAALKGEVGVVFEESDAYGDGHGPMVKWTTCGSSCNVYDADVVVLW